MNEALTAFATTGGSGRQRPSPDPRALGILNNSAYIGRIIWNHSRKVRDPHSGKRLMRPRSEFEWLWVERPELRIVSDELCVQAQARRAERRFSLTDRTQGVRPKYLLTGLCVCGECGGRYIVQYHRHGVRHFGCAVHYDRGATVCRSDKLVRRDVLESKVLEHVFGDLFAPERLDCLEAAVGAALRSADGQALSMLRSVRRRFRISGASVTTS